MTDTHKKCTPCGGHGWTVDPESWATTVGKHIIRSAPCERCKGTGWVPVGQEAELEETHGQIRMEGL